MDSDPSSSTTTTTTPSHPAQQEQQEHLTTTPKNSSTAKIVSTAVAASTQSKHHHNHHHHHHPHPVFDESSETTPTHPTAPNIEIGSTIHTIPFMEQFIGELSPISNLTDSITNITEISSLASPRDLFHLYRPTSAYQPSSFATKASKHTTKESHQHHHRQGATAMGSTAQQSNFLDEKNAKLRERFEKFQTIMISNISSSLKQNKSQQQQQLQSQQQQSYNQQQQQYSSLLSQQQRQPLTSKQQQQQQQQQPHPRKESSKPSNQQLLKQEHMKSNNYDKPTQSSLRKLESKTSRMTSAQPSNTNNHQRSAASESPVKHLPSSQQSQSSSHLKGFTPFSPTISATQSTRNLQEGVAATSSINQQTNQRQHEQQLPQTTVAATTIIANASLPPATPATAAVVLLAASLVNLNTQSEKTKPKPKHQKQASISNPNSPEKLRPDIFHSSRKSNQFSHQDDFHLRPLVCKSAQNVVIPTEAYAQGEYHHSDDEDGATSNTLDINLYKNQRNYASTPINLPVTNSGAGAVSPQRFDSSEVVRKDAPKIKRQFTQPVHQRQEPIACAIVLQSANKDSYAYIHRTNNNNLHDSYEKQQLGNTSRLDSSRFELAHEFEGEETNKQKHNTLNEQHNSNHINTNIQNTQQDNQQDQLSELPLPSVEDRYVLPAQEQQQQSLQQSSKSQLNAMMSSPSEKQSAQSSKRNSLLGLKTSMKEESSSKKPLPSSIYLYNLTSTSSRKEKLPKQQQQQSSSTLNKSNNTSVTHSQQPQEIIAIRKVSLAARAKDNFTCKKVDTASTQVAKKNQPIQIAVTTATPAVGSSQITSNQLESAGHTSNNNNGNYNANNMMKSASLPDIPEFENVYPPATISAMTSMNSLGEYAKLYQLKQEVKSNCHSYREFKPSSSSSSLVEFNSESARKFHNTSSSNNNEHKIQYINDIQVLQVPKLFTNVKQVSAQAEINSASTKVSTSETRRSDVIGSRTSSLAEIEIKSKQSQLQQSSSKTSTVSSRKNSNDKQNQRTQKSNSTVVFSKSGLNPTLQSHLSPSTQELLNSLNSHLFPTSTAELFFATAGNHSDNTNKLAKSAATSSATHIKTLAQR